MKPVKIFEYKGIDWMKGLSIQPDMALGGNFQTAINFNPFERMGYFQATLASVIIDAVTITTLVKHLVVEADGYVYALGDRSGTGTKSFYRIKLSDNTVVDYSSVIDQNAGTGALPHNGMTIYGGPGESARIIYEQGGSLRSNSLITPTVGNDTNILTSALSAGAASSVDFVIGSDLSLYYTANQGTSVGKIVTVVGTTNNTNTAFALERGVNARSLTSDGYYVVVMADDNDSRLTTVTGKCKVYFWDKVKSTADVIWTINDAYLIGGRFVNGSVKILGYAGIWECNLHTPPKLIYPITNKSLLPSDVSQIGVQDTNLVWAAGTGVSKNVYSYGSLIGRAVLYNPYSVSGGSDINSALTVAGEQLLVSSTTNVYIHNTGSTRSNGTIQNATQNLDTPFTLAYAKVVLKDPLSAGQTVILSLTDSNSRVIMDTSTKAFSTVGAKKDLIFQPNPISGGTINKFEDLLANLTVNGGVVVKRLAVYGIPLGDDSQTL